MFKTLPEKLGLLKCPYQHGYRLVSGTSACLSSSLTNTDSVSQIRFG